jgi:uncharacterized protein YndB with AHSA1/START domain
VLGVALACAVPLLYSMWLRPRVLTWGATPGEVADVYPGDELIPDAHGSATMATTLRAPPETVWRWLVQMGGDRAGWYSWDGLDNNGMPSAESIVPQWQHLETGQRLSRASAPGHASGWFTVAAVEPNRTLVLRSSYGLFSGLQFDPRSLPWPRAWVDGVWSLHLRRTADGQTRLVARSRSRSSPRAVARPLALLVGEPTHFVMQTRQFRNLARRVAVPPR